MTTAGPFRTRSAARRMLLVGVAGVVAGVGMFVLVLIAADSGNVDIKLGDDVFRAGRVESLVDAIDRDGPLAFSDVAFRGRPIYVHHVGDDLEQGWLAVEAQAPAQGPECILEWRSGIDHFADPCTGDTYPPGSPQLVQLATRVEGGFVLVDLRGA